MEAYWRGGALVTLENIPPLEGFSVVATALQALLDLVTDTPIAITIDTTHYAQMGVDIRQAGSVLKGKVARPIFLYFN